MLLWTACAPPACCPRRRRAVPLRIAGELTPDDPALPFRLTVAHPLLDLAAEGGVTARSAQATLILPDLAALAAPNGVDLAGSARFDLRGAADDEPQLDATGELALTRAPGPRPELVQGLLGPAARHRPLGSARWRRLAGGLCPDRRGAHQGSPPKAGSPSDSLALGWTLDLPDLSVLAPGWSGRLQAQGGIAGTPAAPGTGRRSDPGRRPRGSRPRSRHRAPGGATSRARRVARPPRRLGRAAGRGEHPGGTFQGWQSGPFVRR